MLFINLHLTITMIFGVKIYAETDLENREDETVVALKKCGNRKFSQ
jgi:hypothetical protein